MLALQRGARREGRAERGPERLARPFRHAAPEALARGKHPRKGSAGRAGRGEPVTGRARGRNRRRTPGSVMPGEGGEAHPSVRVAGRDEEGATEARQASRVSGPSPTRGAGRPVLRRAPPNGGGGPCPWGPQPHRRGRVGATPLSAMHTKRARRLWGEEDFFSWAGHPPPRPPHGRQTPHASPRRPAGRPRPGRRHSGAELRPMPRPPGGLEPRPPPPASVSRRLCCSRSTQARLTRAGGAPTCATPPASHAAHSRSRPAIQSARARAPPAAPDLYQRPASTATQQRQTR